MPLTDLAAVDVTATTTAMASHVTVRAVVPAGADTDARQALDAALEVFHAVDRTCTRFAGDSDLMRANRGGGDWVAVDRHCFDALVEAYAAYRRTQGRFDPRVLDDLVRLGYDVSYRHRPPAPRDPAAALTPRAPRPSWQPRFRGESREVSIGPDPVDLGGIGKGLAVRWAAQRLAAGGLTDFLVEAGGDCLCAGAPSDAPGWRVSVEDPRGDTEPVAVLEVRDEAVATSSVRVRSWHVDGRPVHHLIDPATGTPGGGALAAVTVVDTDPAHAEVWSKVLFLSGRTGVAATATLYGVAALWVDDDGAVGVSPQLGRRLLWTAS